MYRSNNGGGGGGGGGGVPTRFRYDFFNLKLPILANFGKIGNKIFLDFLFFTRYPLHLPEYSFLF